MPPWSSPGCVVKLDPSQHAVTGGMSPESLPGRGWLGMLLAFSVAGPALVVFLPRRLGRWGGLVVAAGCGVLVVRDATMVATGVPARLRPVPRRFLVVELATFRVATSAGPWAWVRRPSIGKTAAVEGTAVPQGHERTQHVASPQLPRAHRLSCTWSVMPSISAPASTVSRRRGLSNEPGTTSPGWKIASAKKDDSLHAVCGCPRHDANLRHRVSGVSALSTAECHAVR